VVGATAVAVNRDSPSSVPRFAESDLPAIASKSVGHLADPSSACVPVWFGSRLHRRSTARSATRPSAARTSGRDRWLPSLLVPGRLVPQAPGKMSLLPPDAAAVVPATLLCRYQPTQFAETRGGDLLL